MTDLTLHCLMETLKPKEDTQDSSASKLSHPQVNGIVIALCCHHRCDWSSFVGRDWWLAQGLTAKDFMAVSHMSSWATCGPATVWRNKRAKTLEEKEAFEENLNNHESGDEIIESDIDSGNKVETDNMGTAGDVTNQPKMSNVTSSSISITKQVEGSAGTSGVDDSEESSRQESRIVEHDSGHDYGHRSKVNKVDKDSDVHTYGGGDVSAQRYYSL